MKAKVKRRTLADIRVKGMTLAEHRTLGAQLKATRDAIVHLVPVLRPRCGQKEALKAYEWIDSLRYQLENKLHEDFPNEATSGH